MFRTKLQKNIYNNLRKFTFIPVESGYSEYMLAYIISSAIGLLSLWHEHDKDLSDEEFIKMAQTLIAKGILGFSNRKL